MEFLKSNSAGRLVILLATALTLGMVALTPATASDGHMPFQARVSGSAAFTSPTTVEFHGAGQATHLGWFVGSGVAILEPPTGTCPSGTTGIPNVHTETLTAANGDELVIRMVNVGCPTGPFTFHGTGHWTVVGRHWTLPGRDRSGNKRGRRRLRDQHLRAHLDRNALVSLSSLRARVALSSPAKAEEDAFAAGERDAREGEVRVTSSKPKGSWSSIETVLRAFAKYHASFPCSVIQSRRACVSAVPTPARR